MLIDLPTGKTSHNIIVKTRTIILLLSKTNKNSTNILNDMFGEQGLYWAQNSELELVMAVFVLIV